MTDLGTALIARTRTILKMKEAGLSLCWLGEYELEALDACCRRMNENNIREPDEKNKNIQRELILNDSFAGYYASLPHNPLFTGKVERLLEQCQRRNIDITRYKASDLVAALECEHLDAYSCLVLLENFSPAALEEEAKQNLVRSLWNCMEVPLELSAKGKDFLQEPFVGYSALTSGAPFQEVFRLMEGNPDLLAIARLLQERGVEESLSLKDYTQFAGSLTEYSPLMKFLFSTLDPLALEAFLEHWQHNGCPLKELQTLKRLMDEEPDRDWQVLLETGSAYINTFYGARFKNIDLSSVCSYQEGVLIYAITHNKKHFIGLVDRNVELFCSLPHTSLLFQEKLYKEHFNINELTEKTLQECAELLRFNFHMDLLEPGRRYSFQELKALNGKTSMYWQFYHLLHSPSQDYRIQVFRQVCKKDVLRDLEEESLPVLAAMLDKKPLYNWRESDFGHITGLRADDVVQLLLHLDKLQRLVPAMRSQEDVSIALRSLDVADQFDSIGTLKESLLQTDEKWLMLAQKLELTPEFLTQYKESILSFLCRNGAAIAAAYMTNLGSTQREGFLRVVKAELMGKFHELKYHADDLQKELAAPLPNQVLDGWKQNLFMVKNHIAVEECDDFFSTMLAGVQPQRTCLSFKNGAYKECLLAGFDSNKKLLYAKSGDRVAGRAFLRLTKASLTRSGEASSSLTFIDVEHPDTVETQPSENIVLFLERPYVSGVDMETRKAIESMLVKAAIEKAEKLGVMLVLSRDYRHVAADGFTQTRLYLYISRSKAGKQYLDSLNGEAGVSSEGSYRDNSFLVRQAAE